MLGPDGRIRSSTLGNVATTSDLPFPPSGSIGLTRGSDLSFQRTWTHEGIEYRLALLERPASASARDAQRLLILLSEPGLRAAAVEARRDILLLSLIGATLAAILASWIGRTLSRPLSAIHRAIRAIGRGDLQPSGLPLDRNDEIGELAEGVSQMARWLERLQEEQVQTERLRLIRQVSAGLAHELRNPLTAARMTLQLHNERNRDRDNEPVKVALAELERMERQVRRFLQIARPEPPRFVQTDLVPILERSVASLSAAIAHQGVSLDVQWAHDRILVNVDDDQIGQVVNNLMLNALDAAGPAGRVRLRTSLLPSGEVAIDVEDDGAGVAPDHRGRLFQPFFSTKPEGVGLGLALCKALVKEHGGEIIYDRSDGWTRFRVRLPTAHDHTVRTVVPSRDSRALVESPV